ncbi:hypothetical protein BY458DRAFT_499572 [Sporodiniella umbellata]|nr:hypothetical protein BY458DRAFT_499572 [Sporodiniella umbellata]
MGAYRRDNPNCGKRVEVVGPNGKTVEVELVDDCKTCESGDLDLSPAGKYSSNKPDNNNNNKNITYYD